jgi:3-dehydroquinate synthase
VGVFHQPSVVVFDTDTLRTLPARELTAGWCEAIKHGAIGDLSLFERTVGFLEAASHRAAGETEGRARELASIVAAQCAFKAKVVAGDEREDVGRTDAGSRRVLNFGHTVGHALEAVTNYRRFRHGEAVGYGMLAAAGISKRLELIGDKELESLSKAVRLAGLLPRASDLDAAEVARALRSDKKAVGGSVRWILLEAIGRARVVDGREVPERVILDSIREALGARL